jgi:hypothetical protein
MSIRHFTVDVEYAAYNGWHIVKRLPQTDSYRLTNCPIPAYPLSRPIEFRVHVGSVVVYRPPNVDEVPVMFIVKFADLVVFVRIEIAIAGSFRWRRKAVVRHVVKIGVLFV